MKKIGLYGGSFDPVHTEHVAIALSAIKTFSLDMLIVMPTFISPHKRDRVLAPPKMREEMLKIAFGGRKDVLISDYEITKKDVSFTYLTIEHIKEQYGGELYLLVGADMLKDMPTWREPQRIVDSAKIIVTPRLGEDLAAALEVFYDRFRIRPLVNGYVGKNVSGTMIRNCLLLGLDPKGKVDKNVLSFIKENGLYVGGEDEKLVEYVKNALTEKRLYHTAGVMTLAEKYAKTLGVDVYKARLAAMLHDVAKYKDCADYNYSPPSDMPKSIVHQFLGEYICRTELGVIDEEILDAVKFHSTGKANMSDLGRIVFTADLLEEGRVYDGVDELRRAVDADFDKGFSLCVLRLFEFLNEERPSEDVYYLSKECKEYYCGR